MNYAKTIHFLRKSARLTQGELAELINVKRHTICDWETERTEPNLSNFKALAKIFNVNVNYLLGINEQMYNESIGFDMQKDYLSFIAKTNSEKELMKSIKSLDEQQQEFIKTIIEKTIIF